MTLQLQFQEVNKVLTGVGERPASKVVCLVHYGFVVFVQTAENHSRIRTWQKSRDKLQ